MKKSRSNLLQIMISDQTLYPGLRGLDASQQSTRSPPCRRNPRMPLRQFGENSIGHPRPVYTASTALAPGFIGACKLGCSARRGQPAMKSATEKYSAGVSWFSRNFYPDGSARHSNLRAKNRSNHGSSKRPFMQACHCPPSSHTQ